MVTTSIRVKLSILRLAEGLTCQGGTTSAMPAAATAKACPCDTRAVFAAARIEGALLATEGFAVYSANTGVQPLILTQP